MKQNMRAFQRLSLLAAACIAAPNATAAAATADAKFLGIFDVRTTATATFAIGTHSVLEAVGMTTGGTDDPFNDGTTFDSETSSAGEGTATNTGHFSATSLATTSLSNTSHAFTFADIEIALGGAGTVEIDFDYSLLVDAFENLADGFAIAGIEISSTFADEVMATIDLTGSEVGGFGASETLAGILTLVLEFDDLGSGPFADTLFIHTFASAKSSPVPVPAAVWLLGSALVGAAGFRRVSAG